MSVFLRRVLLLATVSCHSGIRAFASAKARLSGIGFSFFAVGKANRIPQKPLFCGQGQKSDFCGMTKTFLIDCNPPYLLFFRKRDRHELQIALAVDEQQQRVAAFSGLFGVFG